MIKNNDEWIGSEGLNISGKTHIPCFIKITLLRDDRCKKRKELVSGKILLRSVSTDVLGTPSISTELFQPMKHPELLSTVTQKRERNTSSVTLYGRKRENQLMLCGSGLRQEPPTLPHDSTLVQTQKNLRTLNFSSTKRKRTEL